MNRPTEPAGEPKNFGGRLSPDPPAPHLPRDMRPTHPIPPPVACSRSRCRPVPMAGGYGPRVGIHHTADSEAAPGGRDRHDRRGRRQRQPRPAGLTDGLPQVDLPGPDARVVLRLAGRPVRRWRADGRQGARAAEPVAAGPGRGRVRQHPSPGTALGGDGCPGSGRADGGGRSATLPRPGRPWSPVRLLTAILVTGTVRGSDSCPATATPHHASARRTVTSGSCRKGKA